MDHLVQCTPLTSHSVYSFNISMKTLGHFYKKASIEEKYSTLSSYLKQITCNKILEPRLQVYSEYNEQLYDSF